MWSHTMGDGFQIDADTNPRSGEGKYGGEGGHEGMFVPYLRPSTPFYIALLISGAAIKEWVVAPINTHIYTLASLIREFKLSYRFWYFGYTFQYLFSYSRSTDMSIDFCRNY
jgi:hypothetical protein